jgi:energy-coupling factor transport system ATP-binding protein
VREALYFDDVTFRYPGTTAPALDHVDVGVPEGAFALAVGPTGAGKSTLLRAANGLVPQFSGGVFSGRVTVAGRDTMAHAPRELADVVAFVPQDPASSFVLDRVEDELAYGMENLGVDPVHMRRRVEEMLDLLDIAELRDRSVRTLSGGERQRVAIAAALSAGPRILVLDEPTSQLDPQAAEHVMAALQRLVHDHGMTVLLAEHRLERVAGWIDLALGIDAGRVSPGEPGVVLRSVAEAPPVTRLGRLVGWEPAPLTVREARAHAADLRLRALNDIGEPRAVPIGARVRSGARARSDVAGRSTVASLSSVDVRYGDAPALRDVDLAIDEGETIAVMGRNGAGKSSLLRALAGLQPPSRGDVTVRGRSPHPGIDVALCPQEPDDVLFNETVEREIEVTLGARADGRNAGEGRVDRRLERLGIAHLRRRHPRDLSAGERLLVAVAAIAATDAPLLLLDEPTRGLDPASKARLVRSIHGRAAEGGATVVATHDVELAAAVATRVVMLAGGEIVADGEAAVVLGDSHVFAPQMTRVFGPGWLTPEQVAEAIE